jgi:hypothetical protein
MAKRNITFHPKPRKVQTNLPGASWWVGLSRRQFREAVAKRQREREAEQPAYASLTAGQ